jgi:hypothetical protein
LAAEYALVLLTYLKNLRILASFLSASVAIFSHCTK